MIETTTFETIQNYHEQQVLAAVAGLAPGYPGVRPDLFPDVACVALNRLPPRYIRHAVDLAFYMSDKERVETEQAVDDAVRHAFEFVQARTAMRARR